MMDSDIISQNIGQARLEKLRRNSTRNQSDLMNQTGSCIQNNNRNKAARLCWNKTDTIENTELKEACQGFEAIFLNSLMKSMRTSLPGDGLFQESHGMGIYKSMYDRYLTEDIAENSPGMGIGEYLYRQLQDQGS